MKILGAQDNIEYEPKDFKIKDDFLSKKSIFELKMIQKDLQFKTEVIENVLNNDIYYQYNRDKNNNLYILLKEYFTLLNMIYYQIYIKNIKKLINMKSN